ncbi:lactonase family protein [Streptomyces sp. AK02-01A]|uniref:lactonase family protein n=1 Tax=Streptomyces sp. AK02-01A TaxID=3028648 RepID=UPI0029A5DBDC|nr:lactonase family protein [Streptomyces sp. AK02-01A]MDX3854747.1 lactonase family protein [Streptomyces sp. AK02-01A]
MSGRNDGRAFIGSFTSAGGRGIIAAAVDAETGALTERAATDAVADPSFLALAADGSVLYAVSEQEEGAAAAFLAPAIAAVDAAPRLIGEPVPVCGAGPTHLALAAGHLLTANYGSGSVSVLPVGDDGGLRAVSGVLQHEGGGPDPDRQRGPHAHQVTADPSGRWMLSTDLGTDSVRICSLDAVSGELTTHGETALRPGTGPRHLAFHPAGGHAYVLCELEPTLTVCRWDAGRGVLEPVGETSVLPDSVAVESFASEVVVARDGRFVWVANRGHDSIAVLALDETYEKAELVTTVPCGGRWPRDLALDPAGRRLYAANEHSGDVTWFDIDQRTGVPVRAGSIEAPAASCVIFG